MYAAATGCQCCRSQAVRRELRSCPSGAKAHFFSGLLFHGLKAVASTVAPLREAIICFWFQRERVRLIRSGGIGT